MASFYSSLLALFMLLSSQNTAFIMPSFPQRPSSSAQAPVLGSTRTPLPHSSRHLNVLQMSFLKDDPFQVLNLNPTADKREIKRAYKRMALKYHPDVVCNSESTPEQRRAANDVFAKINWAYEQLNGKNGASSQTSASSSSTSRTKSGYTPPHRRTSSTSYSTNTASTDWRDYIPNYKDDEQYDDGGDSFGAILSDLLSGVAAGAAGSGGIFRDFVEFLEDNVDGYTSNQDDDDLYTLLRTGTTKEVGMEMDDTELVVQQLESKKKNVADELLMKTADLKFASKFSEKVELQERIAELQARKKVVEGYLKRARKRLLQLQSRYKELIVAGDTGSYGRSSSSTESWGGSSSSSSRSSSYSSASSFSTDRRTASSNSTRPSSSTSGSSNKEYEWKTQGFGSSGRRGRGSSRRGQNRPVATVEEPRSNRSKEDSFAYDRLDNRAASSPRQDSSFDETGPPRPETTTRQSTENWKPPVPPHRRTASEPTQSQKDKKRLRELQVDDEFEKLKKDLGL